MNRKVLFVLSVLLSVALMFLTIILKNQYDEAVQEFNYAGGAFFFAVIALFNCKNADKPIKDWGPYDSVKAGLQNRGKLHHYKYWATGSLIISMIFGFIFLFKGVIKIIL